MAGKYLAMHRETCTLSSMHCLHCGYNDGIQIAEEANATRGKDKETNTKNWKTYINRPMEDREPKSRWPLISANWTVRAVLHGMPCFLDWKKKQESCTNKWRRKNTVSRSKVLSVRNQGWHISRLLRNWERTVEKAYRRWVDRNGWRRWAQ